MSNARRFSENASFVLLTAFQSRSLVATIQDIYHNHNIQHIQNIYYIQNIQHIQYIKHIQNIYYIQNMKHIQDIQYILVSDFADININMMKVWKYNFVQKQTLLEINMNFWIVFH